MCLKDILKDNNILKQTKIKTDNGSSCSIFHGVYTVNRQAQGINKKSTDITENKC